MGSAMKRSICSSVMLLRDVEDAVGNLAAHILTV
jgi:hypothetical protein